MMLRTSISRGKVIPRSFFGIHLVSLTGWLGYTTPFPFSLNIGSARLWDTGTTWKRIETSKGVFDWTRLDAVLAVLEANGVSEIMFTLGQPPLWATSGVGPATGSFNPNPPTNIQDWRDYVTAIVTRYSGRITAWEVWNEINLAQFWTGTPAQMTQLTQEASAIIRVIDPNAKIIGANTSSLDVQTSLPYMRDNNTYTDIDAIHLYGGAAQPELKLPMVDFTKASQRSFGLDRPIWNTEYTYDHYVTSGIEQSGDNNPMPDDQAAAYISRLLIINWLSGVERCFFYAFDNFGFNNLRLVNSTDRATLTKAGRSFAYLSSLLTGGTLSSFNAIRGWYEAAFSTSSGQYGKVFWCPDGKTGTTDTTAFAEVRDVEGSPVPLSATQIIDMSPIFAFY